MNCKEKANFIKFPGDAGFVCDKNIVTAAAQGHDKMDTLYTRQNCMWVANVPNILTAAAQGHDKMDTLYTRQNCMWVANVPNILTAAAQGHDYCTIFRESA
jgi:hypothetical protein